MPYTSRYFLKTVCFEGSIEQNIFWMPKREDPQCFRLDNGCIHYSIKYNTANEVSSNRVYCIEHNFLIQEEMIGTHDLVELPRGGTYQYFQNIGRFSSRSTACY